VEGRPGRAAQRLLLAYPAPYSAGMSSLGLLSLYGRMNALPDWSAERAFLPDGGAAPAPGSLGALESGDPGTAFDVIGLSVAHELELGPLATLVAGLGVAPRRRDRSPEHHPLVVAGGPLAAINPLPLLAVADVVFVGEADAALVELLHAAATARDRDAFREAHPAAAGYLWPGADGTPPVIHAPDDLLPARSGILTPDAELSDMALVEVARGCHRACAFCASSRLVTGPARTVPADRILAAVPGPARRVGLVGTAVSEHPEIRRLVRTLVESGREVGLSSVRLDRLDAELLDLLHQGGLRSLAVGVDGTSERLRRALHKGVTEAQVRAAADLAAAAGLRRLKLYQLVGVPDETDADLDEFVALARDLSRVVPLAVTLSPFVPKPRTPLADAPLLPVSEVERRLGRVNLALGGKAVVRAGSARWAWVEAVLSAGDEQTGEIVVDTWLAGGAYGELRRRLNADLVRRGREQGTVLAF
jgi:radical SAM superfamily enzyme YgiQ (UPF0313 family)